MKKVYIVAAKRTAVGTYLGTLKDIKPGQLGGQLIKSVVNEVGVNPAEYDEVIMGNVLSAGQAQGVGRQCAINGGLPVEVPGYSINIMCGSGMKAVMQAYSNIKAGDSNLVIAGGVEVMSGAPHLVSHKARHGLRMGHFEMKDHMVLDGLTDAFHDYHMGITAENVAEQYGISREEQDEFALESQLKAIKAVDSGRFKDEIVPVTIKSRKEEITFDTDEYPNRKASAERLSKLRTVFKKDGTVTAGNASGINDGASVMVIASEEAVVKYNLKPIAEVVAIGQAGVDPSIMGIAPAPAIEKTLEKANMNLKDIDLIELNEAFAAQSLGVIKILSEKYGVSKDWFLERTNVNGGAIALGHPIGASGNKISVTLIHEMKKRGLRYGLASLCIGGGMATTLILKNID